jgi:DNA recombination protein RmuC
MISSDLLFLAAFFFLGFVILAWILVKKTKSLNQGRQNDQVLMEWLKSMQQSLEKTHSLVNMSLSQNNKNVTDTLSRSTEVINQRLDNASTVVAEVSRELARMSELGQSIKDLQFMIQSPKLRGNLGEEILADMLGQVFPKSSFYLQHTFKSGVRVDAAIRTMAGIVCIDAKFPMENYQKKLKAETQKEKLGFEKLFISDVKKHIKDISTKYILVDEGTVDFAFMYLPSESVFQEISNYPEIIADARSKRVYPVSPNTLYAHLQTILLSFEGQKIESKARMVMGQIKAIQKEHLKLEENLQILGRHLTNASSQFNNASQQLTHLGAKITQANLLEDGVEEK